MRKNTVFVAVFPWTLVNMVESCAAFGCKNRGKNDTCSETLSCICQLFRYVLINTQHGHVHLYSSYCVFKLPSCMDTTSPS